MSTNPQDFQNLLAQDARWTAEKHSDTHRKPITDLLTADLVCISVGEPVEKVYHVHRTLLCARDPVFNAGYGPNSEFDERQKSELKLANQMPQVADLFVNWLYSDTGTLPIITIGGNHLPVIKEKSLPAYIHLFTFADSRCIKSLQSEALKQIVHFYSRMDFFVLEPTLCLVYDITPPKCRLRDFMARAWCYHQMRRQSSSTRSVVELAKRDAEFGEDLVLAMAGWAARQWAVPDNGF